LAKHIILKTTLERSSFLPTAALIIFELLVAALAAL
jgi:hypothetical protein